MSSVAKIFNTLQRHTNYVALFVVRADHYQEASLATINYFTQKKKLPGVYVTVNKPFTVLKDRFEKHGINTELIIFIDAITYKVTSQLEDHEHCFYLEHPSHLSDISIAVSEAVEAIDHKEKFIFIDSLSTLLVYNKEEVLVQFIHFLIGKMRDWNVAGIIIALKNKKEEALLNKVSQFCDFVLELT